MRRALATSLSVHLLLLTGTLWAGDGADSPAVVSAENQFGQVWVNLTVTGLRLGEPYVPMVVAVYNRSGDEATLGRSSFRLYGKDGRVVTVAGVKELRKAYDKVNMDHRIANSVGIPVGSWRRRRAVAESNFFPSMTSTRGGTTIDRVSLPPHYGMIDLLYFECPRGLALGELVVLEVAPEGWEEPVRLRLRIAP